MAGRSAKGTGTIRKKTVTRNGKKYEYWEARYTEGADPGTGKQVQRSITGKTQKEVREKLQALKLIGPEHCETDSFSSLDYTGKVLVLSPDALREKFWRPENQLWLALDGFGCSPGAIGRSVRCICLWDGETTRWNRSEFAGVLKEEYLPDWAKEKLEQLRPSAQEPQLSL